MAGFIAAAITGSTCSPPSTPASLRPAADHRDPDLNLIEVSTYL